MEFQGPYLPSLQFFIQRRVNIIHFKKLSYKQVTVINQAGESPAYGRTQNFCVLANGFPHFDACEYVIQPILENTCCSRDQKKCKNFPVVN